MDELSC